MSHENTDIAIEVVSVVQELTDEDVGAEVDDLAEEEGEGSGAGMATRTRLAMAELIDELVSLFVPHLGSCLSVAQQLDSRPSRRKPVSSDRNGRD